MKFIIFNRPSKVFFILVSFPTENGIVVIALAYGQRQRSVADLLPKSCALGVGGKRYAGNTVSAENGIRGIWYPGNTVSREYGIREIRYPGNTVSRFSQQLQFKMHPI